MHQPLSRGKVLHMTTRGSTGYSHALADDRRAVLLEVVDRVLGEHASKATITVDEYARDIAGCGRSAAYEAVRRGQVPSFRVARRIVIPVPAVAALLLGCADQTTRRRADVADVEPVTTADPRPEDGDTG